MTTDCLKLTTYCAERDRVGGRLVADALIDVYARHRLRASVLLRGTEGFGARDHQTQRLLTLSENLPIVSVAVDTRERIEAIAEDVSELVRHGLVTLERARLLDPSAAEVDGAAHETKLTIYCGRQERAQGVPAHVAAVDALYRHGVAGATVLLGVDGTADGARRRARFLGRNAEVPLMIISVGDAERFADALPEISGMFASPLITLEKVRVLKRDGQRLAAPSGGADCPGWQKLMIYSGEQHRTGRHPLYVELVRRLREAGADGATAVRGLWGYHGDHVPHGDKLLALRRHVPVVTIAVDTPQRVREWWPVVDELTAATGLVTSEIVPAARAAEGAAPQLTA